MSKFALLWSSILDSSLWITGSKETRILWITMLAMRDMDGQIKSSIVGLADRAKISIEECRFALHILLSPDPLDTSGVKEGRRIELIDGGWSIVNHERYQFSTDAKRAYWSAQKRKQRTIKKGTPLPGEIGYVKRLNAGLEE